MFNYTTQYISVAWHFGTVSSLHHENSSQPQFLNCKCFSTVLIDFKWLQNFPIHGFSKQKQQYCTEEWQHQQHQCMESGRSYCWQLRSFKSSQGTHLLSDTLCSRIQNSWPQSTILMLRYITYMGTMALNVFHFLIYLKKVQYIYLFIFFLSIFQWPRGLLLYGPPGTGKVC